MRLLIRGNLFDAYSADVEPKHVDPRATKAIIDKVGIDISIQKSKDINSLSNQEFDYTITLCDNAKNSCPYFSAKTRLIHKGFNDPPKLAEYARTDEGAAAHYRRVRDEIKAFVMGLPELPEGTSSRGNLLWRLISG